MIRRPPVSTRTDTLFPYTTLFRSLASGDGESFCDAVCPQGRLCEDGLAHKTIATPEYEALANYAYHLDAGKFAPFLHRHCCEVLGVRHVLADVRRVAMAETGDIRASVTEPAADIKGHLVVNSTGVSDRQSVVVVK